MIRATIRFGYLAYVLTLAEAFGREKCPLGCANGGTCLFGNSKQQQGGDGTSIKARRSKHYCRCPPDYAGPLCEIKYRPCPVTTATTKLCDNGNECFRDVNNDGVTYYHCECDANLTDYSSIYTRRECAHFSTTFCISQDQDPKGRKKENIKSSLGMASGAYCLNGGRCRDDEESLVKTKKKSYHVGCICPPQWQGIHCQEPTDAALADKMQYNKKEQVTVFTPGYTNSDIAMHEQNYYKTLVWLCIVVVVCAVGSVVYSVYDGVSYNRRRRRRIQEIPTRVPTEIHATNTRKEKTRRKRKHYEPLELGSSESDLG